MRKRKVSKITVYVLLGLILLSLTGITAVQSALRTESGYTQALAEELSRLEQENAALAQRIEDLGTDASAEQLARERLHWVYDNEVVYIDSEDIGGA